MSADRTVLYCQPETMVRSTSLKPDLCIVHREPPVPLAHLDLLDPVVKRFVFFYQFHAPTIKDELDLKV